MRHREITKKKKKDFNIEGSQQRKKEGKKVLDLLETFHTKPYCSRWKSPATPLRSAR